MTLQTLEDLFAGILPNFADEVTIAWQGGEPTLAGLDFFKKAIEFQNKYKRPAQQIHHALQTNGTLLTDDWCQFLNEQKFLVGLSVDGPPQFHDHYRLTNQQTPSSDMVLRGLRLLQKNAVDYNLLCVLNDHNVNHPDEIMHYMLNLGSRWLQFIPAIEWVKDPANAERNILAPYSPSPDAYGKFLCRVFDLWFEKYRKRLSIRIFDAVLNKLVLGQMPFCILDGACHGQMTIEHDGAVFGCDHFVERRWQLAQIGDPNWQNDIHLDGSEQAALTIHGRGYEKLTTHTGRNIESTTDVPTAPAPAPAPGSAPTTTLNNTPTPTLNTPNTPPSPVGERSEPRGSVTQESSSPVAEPHRDHLPGADPTWLSRTDDDRLGTFAARKQHLPEKCKACEWKPFCHGGCPKHRSQGGEIPEPTVLCESYIMFYQYTMPRLQWLAGYLRAGHQPPDPQAQVEHNNRRGGSKVVRATAPGTTSKPRRNAPCPCGSGLKYKHCHG